MESETVLRALGRIASGVSGLLGIEDVQKGLDASRQSLAQILEHQEQMMADFTALNEKLDQQAAALSEAQTRIAEDFAALQDQIGNLSLDAEDQAAVDAAVDKVQASIDTLSGIDPVQPAPDPTEPPTV